jgi:hypothetical protein
MSKCVQKCIFSEFLRSVYELSSSHYLTVNVPYVHLLPEYRPQLYVPEDDLKFLAPCFLYENLPQFDFGEIPHHPILMNASTILNGPTHSNPVDITQRSEEARQFVQFVLSIGKDIFDSGNCGQRD